MIEHPESFRAHCTSKAPGLLGLGRWPGGTVRGLVSIGFKASAWTHLENRPEPKNPNESDLVRVATVRGYSSLPQPDIVLGNITTE